MRLKIACGRIFLTDGSRIVSSLSAAYQVSDRAPLYRISTSFIPVPGLRERNPSLTSISLRRLPTV